MAVNHVFAFIKKQLQHLLHPDYVEWFAEFAAGILQPADFSKPMIHMKVDTRLVF